MADQKWYDEGIRPRVLINWDSFENWGLSPAWKGPFTDAVINAYTRWMNVAGVDLRLHSDPPATLDPSAGRRRALEGHLPNVALVVDHSNAIRLA